MNISLSSLPPPDIIEPLDTASIVEALKADIAARNPQLAPALALESEPLVKLVQAQAYRELLLRARINDAGRGALLAFARGGTLDHLGALVNTRRLTTPVEDGPDIVEADDAFRARIQTAFDRLSTAGPRSAYEAAARSASLDIADIDVRSPAPGEVVVTVLSVSGDGTADAALLAAVDASVSADTVRPLTDQVTVASADPVPVDITATIKIERGVDPASIEAACRKRVEAVFQRPGRIGRDLSFSALAAALHPDGVTRAAFDTPVSDVAIADGQAPVPGVVQLTVEVAP